MRQCARGTWCSKNWSRTSQHIHHFHREPASALGHSKMLFTKHWLGSQPDQGANDRNLVGRGNNACKRGGTVCVIFNFSLYKLLTDYFFLPLLSKVESFSQIFCSFLKLEILIYPQVAANFSSIVLKGCFSTSGINITWESTGY